MDTTVKAKDLMNISYRLLTLGDKFVMISHVSSKGKDKKLIYYMMQEEDVLCLIVSADKIKFCPVIDELSKLIHEKFDFN